MVYFTSSLWFLSINLSFHKTEQQAAVSSIRETQRHITKALPFLHCKLVPDKSVN